MALVQRNYEVIGRDAASVRTAAERTSERLAKADLRIEYLEKIRKGQAKEVSSLKDTVFLLEGQVASRDAEIGSLRRQMDSLSASRDAESRRLVNEALRAHHAKASERMLSAKESLLGLKQDFIAPFLSSMKGEANLRLLRRLQAQTSLPVTPRLLSR